MCRPSLELEWETHHPANSRLNDRGKCFTSWLGSRSRSQEDCGRTRKESTTSSNDGKSFRSEDLCQGQEQCPHSTEDGQHHCGSIPKPHGRNDVPGLSSMVSTEGSLCQQSIYRGQPIVPQTRNLVPTTLQRNGRWTPGSAPRSSKGWVHAVSTSSHPDSTS